MCEVHYYIFQKRFMLDDNGEVFVGYVKPVIHSEEKQRMKKARKRDEIQHKRVKRLKICKTRTHGQVSQSNVYEVEAILNHKIEEGQLHFFVKWLGWSSHCNSWVNHADLNAVDLIHSYLLQDIMKNNK